MDLLEIFFCTLSAYLIGSIPSILWVSKFVYGINIRDHGNGTPTHNNMSSVIGVRPSIFVRIFDVLKGFLASHLALLLYHQYGTNADYEYIILLLTMGLAAVLGHIFPIFAKFKGGKGYHVSIGVFLSLNPLAAVYSIGLALIIYWLSRYPNLGHIVGGLALPLFIIFTRHVYGDMVLPMLIFSSILFLLLFMSHRDIIFSLLYGKEVKVVPKKFRRRIRRY